MTLLAGDWLATLLSPGDVRGVAICIAVGGAPCISQVVIMGSKLLMPGAAGIDPR